jgi:hypothetical protein
MQPIIRTRDELVLEAHPDGSYILLKREGEPGPVHIYLNEARHLADAMCAMTAEVAGFVVGYEEPERRDG